MLHHLLTLLSSICISTALGSVEEYAVDKTYLADRHYRPTPVLSIVSDDLDHNDQFPYYSSSNATAKPAGICHLKNLYGALDQLKRGKPATLDCGIRILSLNTASSGVEAPLLSETDVAFQVAVHTKGTKGLWLRKPATKPTSTAAAAIKVEKKTAAEWLVESGALDLTPALAKPGLQLFASSKPGAKSLWHCYSVAAASVPGPDGWMSFECLGGGCESAAQCQCPEMTLGKPACTPKNACPTGWGRWLDANHHLTVIPSGDGFGVGCD